MKIKKENAMPAGRQKSQSVSNKLSQKHATGKSTFQFADNRPETIQARELQALASNSPQTLQAIQLQTMADDHGLEKEADVMGARATKSPTRANLNTQRPSEVISSNLVQMVSEANYSGEKLAKYKLVKEMVEASLLSYTEQQIRDLLRVVPESEMDIILSWSESKIRKLHWGQNVLHILRNPSKFSPEVPVPRLNFKSPLAPPHFYTPNPFNVPNEGPFIALQTAFAPPLSIFGTPLGPIPLPAVAPQPALASLADIIVPPLGPIPLPALNSPDSENVRTTAFRQNTVVNIMGWNEARISTKISSGHGGVVIFELADKTKLVVKNGNDPEIFASRIAGHFGLKAPETRKATDQEIEIINKKQNTIQPPYLIVEYIEGFTLTELGDKEINKENVKAISKSIGKWLAFDHVIGENDRFGLLNGGVKNAVNSSNFMVNPDQLGSGLVGIDQSTSSIDTNQLIQNINPGNNPLIYTLGAIVKNNLKAKMDEEEIGEIVMKSALEMFNNIKNNLKTENLENLQDGLDIQDKIVQSIKNRITQISTK